MPARRTSSPPIDDVVAYLGHLFDDEFAALIASRAEPSADAYQQKYLAVYHRAGGPIVMGLSGMHGRGNEDLAADEIVPAAKLVEDGMVRRRRLFRIRRHRDPSVGALFRCDVSPSNQFGEETQYGDAFFVGIHKGRFALLSIRRACLDCEATGTIRRGPLVGKSCRDCGGTGWAAVSGLDLDVRKLSPIEEERRFEAPTDPVHRADWEGTTSGEHAAPKKRKAARTKK